MNVTVLIQNRSSFKHKTVESQFKTFQILKYSYNITYNLIDDCFGFTRLYRLSMMTLFGSLFVDVSF